MLWLKAWNDTRLRLLASLVLIGLVAWALLSQYPDDYRTMTAEAHAAFTSPHPENRFMGYRFELASTYRHYAAMSALGPKAVLFWTIAAAMLGSGGIAAQAAKGGGLFTLALPISRDRLLWTRFTMGAIELAVLALVPALVVSVFTPYAVGQNFPLADALFHAWSIFVGSLVVLAIATLFSTMFRDQWRPFLLSVAVSFVLDWSWQLPWSHQMSTTLDEVMSAWQVADGGAAPWVGWLVCLAGTGALLFVARSNLARRDF